MEALCCILNYNLNDNANYLYNEFNKYCKTCVLDSDSINPYTYFENVGNYYYTNLFNKSIEKFKTGNYINLILITSDVQINQETIKYLSNIANSDMKDIGIYNIQSDKNSKDWFNKWSKINEHKINNDLTYDTEICEGFLNIYHHDVVLLHEYIPLIINKYGVCINEYSCELSKYLNKRIIVDLKHTLYHPPSKGYDRIEAHSYDKKFKKWFKAKIEELKKNIH